MQQCPSCFKNPPTKHLTLGLLPCSECTQRQDKLLSPSDPIEIIPDRIKSERQERGDSIEQPHLKGELNKKWLDLWGEGAAKERGFGGDSHWACINCHMRLSVHISHKLEENPTRYFCKWCGNKYTLKISEGNFLEVYNGELGRKGFKPFFNNSPDSVID